ncbi:MAG: hypothetical protein ACE5NW_05810 [Acidiferrobacterales bacterium]
MEPLVEALQAGRGFLGQFWEFLPKLLLAIVTLVAGWLIAKFLMFIVVKGLKMISFNKVTEFAGMDKFLKQGGIKKTTIDILGILIYWLAILFTLLIAFEILGLKVVTSLFGQVAAFIPQVIFAVIILAIGLYFARFVEDAVVAYAKNVGIEGADLMGRLSRYAIIVFVVIIALDQVATLTGDILQDAFLILFAGIVLALALAFGLGGQKWAAGQLDRFMKQERRKK